MKYEFISTSMGDTECELCGYESDNHCNEFTWFGSDILCCQCFSYAIDNRFGVFRWLFAVISNLTEHFCLRECNKPDKELVASNAWFNMRDIAFRLFKWEFQVNHKIRSIINESRNHH